MKLGTNVGVIMASAILLWGPSLLSSQAAVVAKPIPKKDGAGSQAVLAKAKSNPPVIKASAGPAAPALPPAARTGSGTNAQPMSFIDQFRLAKAEQIKQLGYNVEWQKLSAAQLSDMELRAQKATRLRQFGYPQENWQALSLSQLADQERKAATASALRRRGVFIDPERLSAAQLADLQMRVSIGERLAREGKLVNWTQYSTSKLSAMEAELLHSRGRTASISQE